MDTNDPIAAHLPVPTADRPLLGLTILVVEDSRFACEAIRLLCLRSGARIRRADCLRSARRHLRVYRPSVLMVDFGLPDGNGLDLIAELSHATPRVEVIIGMSGDQNTEAAALIAGADGFIAKPFSTIAAFQERLLSLLPEERRPSGPRRLDETPVVPDRIAYHDDIAHIADVLEDPQNDLALDYVAQFLTGVAHSAEDRSLENAARQLASRRAQGQTAASETATLAAMIQERLAQKIAI
ncbi:MAG: response regulator [Sulfitobacter sp.]|nr:response regulator [Sulfitobacter sp.]